MANKVGELDDGVDLTEEAITPAHWNDSFDAVAQSLPPIGTVCMVAKTITGCPTPSSRYVLCNGNAVSDADSPINGQNTYDLITDNKFPRAASTSGGVGGEATHQLSIAEMPEHHHSYNTRLINMGYGAGSTGGASSATTTGDTGGDTAHNNEPQYTDLVPYMRIK